MQAFRTGWHKYWTIFLLSWQSGLVYRASFVLWRFRQLLSTLMAITIWSVVFQATPTAFGYTGGQMLSYVLLVSWLQSIILATSLNNLSGEIYSGAISHHFLKPEKLFLSFAAAEVADKLRNFLFSMSEGLILIAVFRPAIQLPDLVTFLAFLLWVAAGTVIHFYISIWFGTLGFWSPQTWGPKFLFFMFIDFTAGKLYPLDILPPVIRNALYFTPFPYLSYAQIQLFLGRFSGDELRWWWAGLVFWLVASWWLARTSWRRGISNYEAVGG